MDFQLFTAINEFAGQSWLLDASGIFFAVYALPVFFAVVLILAIKNSRVVILVALSSGIVYVLNLLIGYFAMRHRPFVDHEVNKLVEKVATSKSFPSDHAALAFVIASLLSFFYPRWSRAFYVWAFLIALSRIFVGVHYPLDVAAGIIIGIAVALAVRRCMGIRQSLPL